MNSDHQNGSETTKVGQGLVFVLSMIRPCHSDGSSSYVYHTNLPLVYWPFTMSTECVIPDSSTYTFLTAVVLSQKHGMFTTDTGLYP